MQELHCRPLFQAIPLNERVESFCKNQSRNELVSEDIKNSLHKKTHREHDSTSLWPEFTNQDTQKNSSESNAHKDVFSFYNSKILGIIGVGLMGIMLTLSMVKSFFPKDDD